MFKYLENDFISCSICSEIFYSKIGKNAIVLNCGHTFCRPCLLDMINRGRKTCPSDNKIINIDQNNLIENKIIKTTIELLKFEINIKSLTKLYFYYCTKCQQFISSFCSEVHKTINHKITSIDSYSYEWFDYYYQNLNEIPISNLIKIFLVLYFFQSPYLTKMVKIKVQEKISYNKNKFMFYGETLEKNSSNEKLYTLLINIFSNNNKLSANLSLKKGILMNENYQKIQGYFLEYGKKNFILKGLCIFSFESFSFFGLIKFSMYPISTGFSLEVGILNDSNTYYFGKFSDDSREFPLYELELGEKIYFENNIFKVQKIDKKKKEEYFEYFENNKYFFFQKVNNNRYKISLSNNIIKSNFSAKIDILTKTNSFYIYQIDIIIPKSQKDDIENIIISKRINKSSSNEIFLYETKINLDNYDMTMYFYDDDENILFQNNQSNNNCGYVVKLDDDSVSSIRFANLKDIILDVDILINGIKKILNYNLTRCFIYYYQIQSSNLRRIKNSNYIKIDTFENKILCADGLTNILNFELECKELLYMNIKDLFPDFYTCKAFDNISENEKKKMKIFLICKNKKCHCSIF